MIRDTRLFSRPQVEVWDIFRCIISLKNATFPRYSPRLISPISFFFGPFPKLLLLQEKKIPLFLSALSSRVSSFSDLPDLCFLASCQLKPNKDLTCCALQLYVEQKNCLFAVTERPSAPFSEWKAWSGQSWRCALKGRGCRGSGRGLARVGHPARRACTLGIGRI